MRPPVDVVVVTHQSEAHVRGCLASILESDHDGPVAAVVVDNASTDSTVDVVAGFAGRVRLVRNEVNRGFAAACNQGIRATQGDLVLLLNPDARLERDTLRRLVEYLEEHPDVGIVGPRLVGEDGSLQRDVSATGIPPSFRQALFEYTRLGRWFPSSPWVRDYFLPGFDRVSTRTVAMVQGACFLFPRRLFDEIGGFDERFFLYFEETDFCASAADRGFATHYVGEVAAVHAGSGSHEDRRPSAHHFVTSLYRFHAKHYGGGEALALWSILAPYHGLRVLRLAATVPFKPRDGRLRADLRTAWERFLAHGTMLFDSRRRGRPAAALAINPGTRLGRSSR